MKIIASGDLHLGKTYSSVTGGDENLQSKYIDARYEALKNIINLTDKCDYLVIAGDIFETHEPEESVIKKTCGILQQSACPVIIIAGNHDYCENDDKLWKSFCEFKGENTFVLNKYERFKREKGDAVFYPCPCFERYSKNSNALNWVKEDKERDKNLVNIGIAHGSLESVSCDREGAYFPMTFKELKETDMDLWIIGHAHIPYPKDGEIKGSNIFNAGTHQQTDISNNTEGNVFIIEIDENKKINASRINTGVIFFREEYINISFGESLENKLNILCENYGDKASKTDLRLYLSGLLSENEYKTRESIYKGIEGRFLKLSINDDKIRQEITKEMIRETVFEGSPESSLLKGYENNPELLELAYDLINECKKG